MPLHALPSVPNCSTSVLLREPEKSISGRGNSKRHYKKGRCYGSNRDEYGKEKSRRKAWIRG